MMVRTTKQIREMFKSSPVQNPKKCTCDWNKVKTKDFITCGRCGGAL